MDLKEREKKIVIYAMHSKWFCFMASVIQVLEEKL